MKNDPQCAAADHPLGRRADVVIDSATPADSIPFQLTRRRDAPPIGDELEALAMFREAAQRLKAAELEHVAAQGAYVEALKRLSAEATK